MTRVLICLISGIVFIAPHVSMGKMPATASAELPAHPASADGLPVGLWAVEFANCVIEKVEVRQDGTAFVVEPLRSSIGKPTIKAGSIVIAFEDDRTERWTLVGKRYVVEHWFPSSQLPVSTPVVGIAERVE